MRNDAIRLIKVTTRIFVLALTVSEILRFQLFDLQNLGQGHQVQHSMANVNHYKSHCTRFYASTHHFRDIKVLNV